MEDYKEPDTHLLNAAIAAGGQVIKKPDNWDETKTIKEAIGDRHIRFYPDLPKLEWSTLVDKIFRILNIRIIENWNDPRFGSKSFPLFLIDLEDGTKATTLASGTAILNQAKVLRDSKSCPVKVKLVMRTPDNPGGQPYYFLE